MDAFFEKIEKMFDSYCKKSLKNRQIDYIRDLRKRREREVSLEELLEQNMDQHLLAERDDYFSKQVEVGGIDVEVEGELFDVLDKLEKEKQELLLHYYFLGLNDRQIGELQKLPLSTIYTRRKRAEHELAAIIEREMQDEYE